MGEVTLVPVKKLTVFPWGHGVSDLRYFEANILSAEEVEKTKKQYATLPYNTSYSTFPRAVECLKATMADATPGIYFAGNPHYGTYGKWNCALVEAGFKRVPGCAINRVYDAYWTWKGKPRYGSECNCAACGGGGHRKAPWESADGYQHWIHAFYYIVDGLKGPVAFDFSKRSKEPSSGDDNNSLWQINYGGRNCGTRSWGTDGYTPKFCPKFARLSKNCGIAMGSGLPECGKDLDEEFFTIATLPEGQKFPKSWSVFLEYGGLRWAHNLHKLDTAQVECPHKMKLSAEPK